MLSKTSQFIYFLIYLNKNELIDKFNIQKLNCFGYLTYY